MRFVLAAVCLVSTVGCASAVDRICEENARCAGEASPSESCAEQRAECDEDADCADITSFGFSSYCYELKREDPATGEEVSLGKFCSVGCRTNDDCPRGIRCYTDLPTPTEGEVTSGCIEATCAGFAD